jgi:hypothetical protein
MPNTLAYCFKSHPGKARYTFDLLITADNARSRKIPIEVVFDPAQTDLKYIQLNTRYPWLATLVAAARALVTPKADALTARAGVTDSHCLDVIARQRHPRQARLRSRWPARNGRYRQRKKPWRGVPGSLAIAPAPSAFPAGQMQETSQAETERQL